MNAAGTAVGWAEASGGVPNIATWSSAGTVQLYGGNYGFGGGAYGAGINNAGQIAANFNYLIPGYGVIHHAGRFDPVTRTMTDVFSVNPNGNGDAIGISDSGTIVGWDAAGDSDISIRVVVSGRRSYDPLTDGDW